VATGWLALAVVAAPPRLAWAAAKPVAAARVPAGKIDRAAQPTRRRAAELRAQQARARKLHAQLVAQVATIDHFCDRLADITQDREQRRLFALWSEGGRDRWAEYQDPKNLEWALQNRHVLQVAELWSRADGATAIALTLAGSERDWSSFVDYCFRSDGSLARMEAPLEQGGVDPTLRRSVRRHFATSGGALGTPAPSWFGRFPRYLTAADLPFAPLLRSQAQASR